MGLISFGKGKTKVVAYTTKSGPRVSMPKVKAAKPAKPAKKR
jgi:hypothetical protein